MIKWLKNLFNPWSNAAESKMQALPLVINAPEGVALQRALGRLLNLYSVKNKDAEVLATIEGYKQAVTSFGYTPPNNFTETEQLVRLTRE